MIIISLSPQDPHCVPALLKQFFRELPRPLISEDPSSSSSVCFPLLREAMAVRESNSDSRVALDHFRKALYKLSGGHYRCDDVTSYTKLEMSGGNPFPAAAALFSAGWSRPLLKGACACVRVSVLFFEFRPKDEPISQFSTGGKFGQRFWIGGGPTKLPSSSF